MSSADPPRSETLAAAPMVVISSLTLLAGASGMVVSYSFLVSPGHLDVIAGAAGFLAGAGLAAAGVLSLAVQSRSQATSHVATNAAGCLVGLLPPAIAGLSWPALRFGIPTILGTSFFLLGAMLAVALMPFVFVGCTIWAWIQSQSVADHLGELFASKRVRLLRVTVFTMQLLTIVATWPLFAYFLDLLESMGYRLGWS